MRNTTFLLFFIFLVLLGLYFTTHSKPIPKQAVIPQPTQTIPTQIVENSASSSGVLGVQTKTSGCQVNGPLPDLACSPGAIFPNVTKEQVCTRGYSASVRDVSLALKKQVYNEYGISHWVTGEYEIDHIISLELGGSNDIANLYPEAADPRPGFHEKDQVENYLHQQVCSGQMSLEEAQKEISTNWVSVYTKIK